VLAANRLNLAKAVRAASDRRRLGSPTEAEEEAWRQNLLRARQVLHDDHTWKYATCFRHGLTALSLERSLVLAGESPDEYRAHLARFDRLVRGLEPGPLSDPAKLARAAALVSWRRLRALRLDREWTLRALADCLQHALRAREEAREEGGDKQTSLAADARAVDAPDGLGYLGPDPLILLGLGLEAASCNWIGAWRALTRLNNRFDQLWCALVEELGELPPFLSPSIWWERARMQPSPLVENYTLWPVEVLGNPLLPASRILARLAEHGIRVRPIEEWECHPVFRTLEEAENYRWQEGERRREAEGERLEEGRITVAGDPHYRLLARARRSAAAAGAQDGIGDGSSKGAYEEPAPLPESFEEFLALVERAFGPEPPREPAAVAGAAAMEAIGETSNPETSNRETSNQPFPGGLSPSSVEEGPGVVLPSSPAGRSPNEPPDDAGRVRKLAELLWGRVERVRARAEGEARRLAQLVDAYGDSLGRPRPGDSGAPDQSEGSAAATVPEAAGAPETPQASEAEEEAAGRESNGMEEQEVSAAVAALEERERRAVEILEVFREKKSGRLRRSGRERVIRLAIYDLAVGRFGKQEDFGLLKRPHDRFDQLHEEFFEAFFGYAHHLMPDAGSG
jgi:hypothetical protein